MKDKNVSSLGGACAVLLGASYFIAGIAFLARPGAQKSGAFPEYMASLAQNSWGFSIQSWALILGAIAALAVIPVFGRIVESKNQSLVAWANAMAYLGFAVAAASNMRDLTLEPAYAKAFVGADHIFRGMIYNDVFQVSLDNTGWLAFGLPGTWVLIISMLALKVKGTPRWWAAAGLAAGLAYWLVVIGNVAEINVLDTVAATAAIVLGPIWYMAMGVAILKLRLRRRSDRPRSAAPPSVGPL